MRKLDMLGGVSGNQSEKPTLSIMYHAVPDKSRLEKML